MKITAFMIEKIKDLISGTYFMKNSLKYIQDWQVNQCFSLLQNTKQLDLSTRKNTIQNFRKNSILLWNSPYMQVSI